MGKSLKIITLFIKRLDAYIIPLEENEIQAKFSKEGKQIYSSPNWFAASWINWASMCRIVIQYMDWCLLIRRKSNKGKNIYKITQEVKFYRQWFNSSLWRAIKYSLSIFFNPSWRTDCVQDINGARRLPSSGVGSRRYILWSQQSLASRTLGVFMESIYISLFQSILSIKHIDHLYHIICLV